MVRLVVWQQQQQGGGGGAREEAHGRGDGVSHGRKILTRCAGPSILLSILQVRSTTLLYKALVFFLSHSPPVGVPRQIACRNPDAPQIIKKRRVVINIRPF